MSPAYSPRWRAELGAATPQRTQTDLELLRRVLPLPAYRRVLDVPCGDGRLARPLRTLGYEVTGVDADPAVEPDVVLDLRELDRLPDDFDAVVEMWASFGWFEADENERVLALLGGRLRRGGRLVLDVYNREFFASREGERELRPGIVERSTMRGARRRCEVDYGDGAVDVFEWQLYTPEELEELAARHGLVPVETLAAPERPSMQLVLQRD